MKKIHIVLICIAFCALGAILSTLMSSGTYADFSTAIEKPEDTFTVSGRLLLNAPILYEPEKNPDQFSFSMQDSTGKTMHVILKQAKPYDFERAEGLVVTGQVKNGIFVATEVLLKCPSKYNQQKKIV